MKINVKPDLKKNLTVKKTLINLQKKCQNIDTLGCLLSLGRFSSHGLNIQHPNFNTMKHAFIIYQIKHRHTPC